MIIGDRRPGHVLVGQHFEIARQSVSTPLAARFGRHFETDFRDVAGLDFRACRLRLDRAAGTLDVEQLLECGMQFYFRS
jgi:hypothetical protein